jgi:hypothetical protein
MRPAETNTGLLTRNNPTFDNDILSRADAADAVSALIETELAAAIPRRVASDVGLNDERPGLGGRLGTRLVPIAPASARFNHGEADIARNACRRGRRS